MDDSKVKHIATLLVDTLTQIRQKGHTPIVTNALLNGMCFALKASHGAEAEARILQEVGAIMRGEQPLATNQTQKPQTATLADSIIEGMQRDAHES